MSTNRKRNRNTKPDDYSNQAWKKHLKEVDFQNPLIYQRIRYDQYFTHYFNWLQQIAYQLFEWDGFPDDVPKNYLEVMLHDKGYVGYVEETKYGNILVNGVGQSIGSYNVPTSFQASDLFFKSVSFPVYYFGRYNFPNGGFIIKNKTEHNHVIGDLSSLATIRMYATRLAFIKTISDINLNTQKTPYFLTYDDDLLLEEVQRLFTNVDGNSPVIMTKAVLNEKGGKQLGGQLKDMLSVLDLKSPYLVDKLETQKQKEWDEAMSCFGLMNISQYKKERMTKSESEANVQQVVAMQNALLKPRHEFCDLYKLKTQKTITVKPFTDTIETEGGSYEFTKMDGNTGGLLPIDSNSTTSQGVIK